MATVALGVSDTGQYPEQPDENAMWKFCQKRIAGKLPGAAAPSSCQRPVAPPPPATGEATLGVSYLDGPELDDLALTGWAVLYGPKTSQDIKDALAPLIAFRKVQVHQGRTTDDSNLHQVFDGLKGGYTAGQSAEDWLKSHNVSSINQVRPEDGVPFYLMIVAAPDDIPFEVQYDLDIYWGVGRLWLGPDDPQDYRAYANAVIRSEQPGPVASTRKLTFFAPRFEHDNGATGMLCSGLIDKLMARNIGARKGFAMEAISPAQSTKANLIDLYSGQTQRPGIYFCGSHGLLRTPIDNPHLPDTMGAILCADWDGQSAPGKADYMAARDLAPDTDLSGTVHFLFACYSGGWPAASTYDGEQLAQSPMVARLPQAILSKGGLAVLAHIDRAWSYSYESGGGLDRTQEFESILTRLMGGARAGHATDAFNYHWCMFSNYISEQQRSELVATTEELHSLWVQRDDARDYVLYGDPAVRLPIESMKAPVSASGTAPPDPTQAG